jgi:protease-4
MNKDFWSKKMKKIREDKTPKQKGIKKDTNIFKSIINWFKISNPSEKTLLKYKTHKEQALIIIIMCGLLVEATFIFTLLSKNGLIGSKEESIKVYETTLSKNEEINNKIIILDLDEEITMKTYHKMEKFLEKVKLDEEVKEIVITFNTPGGSPVASEEISEYLKNYEKPLTAYIQTSAASGGYYIASALNKIIANPNAIVGSIGVILPKYNLQGLANKIGVEEDNIEMGKYKAPISLLKPTTEEGKQYIIDNLMKPTYEVFLQRVSENRNIPLKELREKYAEGKIWSASHPEIKGKLIDELNSMIGLKKELNKKYNEGVIFNHFSTNELYETKNLLDLKMNIESETLSKIQNQTNYLK